MSRQKNRDLTPQQEQDFVVSLDADKEIRPYLPDLLKDLWELGCVPSLYVNMLRPLQLPREKTRALDLATGKGAAAVVLARELGFQVLGIDLCVPFLEEAMKRARSSGVSHLCRFVHEDVHRTVQKARGFDLVLLISVGGLLGNFQTCVGKLRRTVRPGGYILIDDGFFKTAQRADRRGYEHYTSHSETLESLTSHGEKIVREVLYSDAEPASINRGYLVLIKKRAIEVAEKHPAISDRLHRFVQNQEEECRFIESAITGACWLLQSPQ